MSFPNWLRRMPLLAASAFSLAAADVVINEVMYHPPEDRDDLQFIEIHNRGAAAVELKDWSFTKGVSFTFPATRLEPGGFAVVCQNPRAFAAIYTNAKPVGAFTGRLKHGGERIELSDATGKAVDAVKFADRAPWPVAPDGFGPSLERISPSGPSDEPGSWTASTLPPTKSPAGTPGRINSAFSANLPPLVRDVTFAAPVPGKPTPVSVTATDADGIKAVELRYRPISGNSQVPEKVVALKRTGGDERQGTYEGTVPALPAGTLLRFTLTATDTVGTTRTEPSPNEPRPTFSAFVTTNTNLGSIPQMQLLTLGGIERSGNSLRSRRGGSGGGTPSRGEATLVYLPTSGGPVLTFDNVRIARRNGGWKVRLNKDQMLGGISTLNLLFEGRPRWALSEHLGYELFRRLGAPTPLTDFARVTINGQQLGYHLVVEQANSSFLRRVGLDPDGNHYKLLWYGQGITGQHEKKNNPHTGHKDLLEVINGVNAVSGEAQWEFIQQHFNVETFVNNYVASMCIQNWDGFFNNYFTYHAPGKDGKWELIPWDLDKTWGEYDGASSDFDWYTMPLTYGMNEGRNRGQRERMSFGFGGWQRPPGYFSGPLLANPQFRAVFLKRLREACETVFTEKDFLPFINALEKRLETEVRYRALVHDSEPDSDLAEFKDNIDSFRRQLKNRRKFILSELPK
jgi:hypothetical protein